MKAPFLGWRADANRSTATRRRPVFNPDVTPTVLAESASIRIDKELLDLAVGHPIHQRLQRPFLEREPRRGHFHSAALIGGEDFGFLRCSVTFKPLGRSGDSAVGEV